MNLYNLIYSDIKCAISIPEHNIETWKNQFLNQNQLKRIERNNQIFYSSLNKSLRDESIYIQGASLKEDEKDLGSINIDLGSGSTSISIFENKKLTDV